MRILLVSTSETVGGAAIAASRLADALNRYGVEAKMLVRDRKSSKSTTIEVSLPRWLPSFIRCRCMMVQKALERLTVFLFTGSKSWDIDIASHGFSITSTKEFREADVVHLHWINQGMLSLDEIGRILDSGKTVVWTLHDLWPVMAIHHHGDIGGEVALTKEKSALGLLASKVWNRKQEVYKRGHITFVGCSRWIADEARRSPLTERHDVVSIPNTFPAGIFLKTNHISCAELKLPENKPIVLFCARNATDERKGIGYLLEACRRLKDEDFLLAVVGASMPAIYDLPQPAIHLGYVNDVSKMAAVYAASSVFVTPSLEENLPNTIMESMACGTPCVGFRVGGIPEMIDHKRNGYVAAYRDSADLAEGIRWVLRNRIKASDAARHKAVSEWGEESVALRFISLYQKVTHQRQE
ncbi:MAG: glycosyltransferase [Bacteroidaceae bacterium]|nr:glycosyltransferase [Bacteroidaceae bacterium]